MFYMLESNNVGYKVVWCHEQPKGGRSNGNWSLIQDGMEWQEAREFVNRLNS